MSLLPPLSINEEYEAMLCLCRNALFTRWNRAFLLFVQGNQRLLFVLCCFLFHLWQWIRNGDPANPEVGRIAKRPGNLGRTRFPGLMIMNSNAFFLFVFFPLFEIFRIFLGSLAKIFKILEIRINSIYILDTGDNSTGQYLDSG